MIDEENNQILLELLDALGNKNWVALKTIYKTLSHRYPDDIIKVFRLNKDTFERKRDGKWIMWRIKPNV